MTQGQGIELLNKSLPYPDQMTEIDLSVDDAIYFTWRASRYKFGLSTCRIDVVGGGMLAGTDAAILMTQCVKKTQLLMVI